VGHEGRRLVPRADTQQQAPLLAADLVVTRQLEVAA
jgi:hypothetical protein